MSKPANYFTLIVSVLALLLSALVFFRSGDTGPAASGGPQANVQSLRVAVVPAPPASLFDAGKNEATGHSVELLNSIAERTSVRVSYVAGNWATVGSALNSGQVDIVIGPVFMTEGRAAEFLFTEPVYEFSVVAVVPANGSTIRTLDDTRRRGIRVAVGRGGFDADFVAKNMPEARVSEFPPDDPNLAMLEVRAGRADLAIVDYGTAIRFAEENSGVRVLEGVVLSRQYAGFMMRPNDVHLKSFLDVALRNLQLSGEGAAVDRRYEASKIWYARPDLR